MNETAQYSLLSANTDATVVALEGYVNFDTADEIYTFIQRQIKAHSSRNLVVEVSNVEYVSSAGIGVFMALQEEVREHGGRVAMVNVQESLLHILNLVGAKEYFLLCETIEDAESRLGA
ncbi:MAG: STAS domain-containing protein [Candidatus Kapaibacteriota bacterium]|jgi:anti-sigma B factor antagonist